MYNKMFHSIRSVLIAFVVLSVFNEGFGQELVQEKINIGIDGECVIPNQKTTRGICKAIKNCPEYQMLFNENDLNVERLSFIINLNCGFDYETWKSLVCCTKPGNTYKKPDLTVDRENLKDRTSEPLPDDASVDLGTRVGEETAVMPQNKFKKCGVQAFTNKIIGGEICELDEFPWAAMMLYESKSDQSIINACGGVLLNEKYVLTAGHCVKGETLERSVILKFVRLGEYDTSTDEDCIQEFGGQLDCAPLPVDIPIQKIIPHPSYKPNEGSKFHDIAIVKLAEPAKFSYFIKPICLPSKEFDSGLKSGETHVVTGWGKTDLFKANNGGKIVQSPIKLKVSVPYVDKETCVKTYEKEKIKLNSSQICAGGISGKDSCAGDSGGPLMHFDENKFQWVVSGIVSFGNKKCGTLGFPAVYTNVTNYLTWIEQNIGSGDEDGPEEHFNLKPTTALPVTMKKN